MSLQWLFSLVYLARREYLAIRAEAPYSWNSTIFVVICIFILVYDNDSGTGPNTLHIMACIMEVEGAEESSKGDQELETYNIGSG